MQSAVAIRAFNTVIYINGIFTSITNRLPYIVVIDGFISSIRQSLQTYITSSAGTGSRIG